MNRPPPSSTAPCTTKYPRTGGTTGGVLQTVKVHCGTRGLQGGAAHHGKPSGSVVSCPSDVRIPLYRQGIRRCQADTAGPGTTPPIRDPRLW